MKKVRFLTLLLAAFLLMQVHAQDVANVKPVKNVILMIPDGTSLATISLARWMQWYADPSKPKLNIDPYICGTVRTHSSNAPIGDSAPTTSCYMTGQPSRTGYVATYPLSDPENDIYPTDPARAYQPLTTVLEAGKLLKGKASGLVFTCYYPHATPADCASHSYKRGKYDWIASQMAHNDLNVVIGGGTSYLTAEDEAYLKADGYGIFKDDIEGMRDYKGKNLWALFGKQEMDYDLDRDPAQQPSLEEMTRKAIATLSQHEGGFFLMVEGSKIDWAAHANDPVGMFTDMLAFDRACGAALEFARKDGQTAVVIVPDHGNSGISIGKLECKGYDKLTKDQLFLQLSHYKLTAEGFVRMLNSRPASEVQDIFRTYAGFELSEAELNALNHCKDYKNSPVPAAERSKDKVEPSLYSGSMTTFMARLMASHTCIGFTTNGHTGEEVLLAAYHPQGTLPMGMLTNIELNHYLCALFGMNYDTLEQLTAENFVPHTEVFKGYSMERIPAKEANGLPALVVKNKKKQITITPFTNLVKTGRKGQDTIRLKSVVVYVDANDTFYVPSSLRKYLE